MGSQGLKGHLDVQDRRPGSTTPYRLTRVGTRRETPIDPERGRVVREENGQKDFFFGKVPFAAGVGGLRVHSRLRRVGVEVGVVLVFLNSG